MPNNQDYKKYAEESAAFYNAFFLDNNDGGVYFNVLANGVPYLVGTERYKGSHSMSAYHSTELCFLSTVYIDLMIKKRPLDLYFKPMPDGFKDRLLRVEPDILPKGSLYISKCEIDGKEHSDYDSETMTVKLPEAKHRLKVKVTISTK